MNLPTPKNLNLKNKKVFLRLDLDVNTENNIVLNDNRLESSLETINYCIQNAYKVILAGHRDRPEGKYDSTKSTHSLIKYLSEKLESPIIPLEFKPFLEDFHFIYDFYINHNDGIFLLENLRFWTGEETNAEIFNQTLSGFVDVYINEAFATSHRKHASVYGLPQLMKSQGKEVAFGFRFRDEISNLSRVFENTNPPRIIIVSGVKQDKLDHLEGLKKHFDKILLAGRLPEFLPENFEDEKVIVAKLIPDKNDITVNSMKSFAQEIKNAASIVLSGPPGKYEEEGHDQGTLTVFDAIKHNTNAFKVAGGGDTEAALKKFDFKEIFDWISTGGGAMLEYLSSGTLPSLEVLN
jgi:3-phosphoglycerate kinase